MAQKSDAKIGVSMATIIGMNAMIGAGIFTAPSAIGSYVGPAGIIVYIFVVIAVWFIAQSLARVAARFPEEGSFYTYAKQWGGPFVGAIAGLCYFTGLLIAMGLLAQVAGVYLQQPLFPCVASKTLGFICLALLLILNMFGMVLSEIGQQILICTTIFPLVITSIMCLSKAQLKNLVPFAPFGLHNVFKATKAVIFGFFGFECATSLFSIVDNPAKNVPRALTYSIAIVGSLYVIFVASVILATPPSFFNDPQIPLSSLLQSLFPDNTWITLAIHFSILSAVVGTIHSMIWSSSVLLVSLLHQIKGIVLNQRIAVLLVGACISLSFATLNNMDLFFSLTATFLIIAFMLSIMSLLFIKEEWESGQNIITVCGLCTTTFILYFAIEGIYTSIAA